MRYITIKTIILFTFCCLSGYSQSPSFVNNLNFTTSFVCYDGQKTINATVANADAYQFQKRNESTNLWENISGASGTISNSPAVISHTFFGIRENITTRVVISKNTSELTSNDITITPQRPIFNFQPLDITQCNGANAIFRVSSSGVGSLSHQWQISTGGVFENISNGSDYSGTTTSSMTVLNLANNENGKVFRCLVKDANNCENYSNSAQLSVNQLSTVVSPTTSTTFCEGQNVQFSVALNVGTVTNYDWQLRKTTESTYTSLQNSSRFENVNTDILKVNGILPNEISYKLNVTYQNLTQNADGSRNTGTCIKSAERTNYTIRPRPAAPVQIDDVFRCSTGKVSASVVSTNKIFWYTDSTVVPFISDNLNFTSPTLSATTKFFYSLKDINGCESYKRTFQAVVRPLPSQSFQKAIQICPTENKFSLTLDNVNNSPLDIYVSKTTPFLPDFTDIVAAPFSNNFEVSLPNTLNSGDYKFKVFTKNQHCFSDTSLVDLKVKIATKILNGPAIATLCEGTNHAFGVQYNAESPVSFKWFKNDLPLPSQTSASLLLENLQPADQAQYKVEVTGDCGIETTENVLLTVLPKIQIIKQPENAIVCQNNTTKFKVEATGTGILKYEWTRNGEPIGSNSPELILENVPLAFHNSLIKCKISSDCEPVTLTDEVLLSVDALPIAPMATASQGFCKSPNPGNLMATALPNHSLHWFDENQTELATNQIDVSSIFTKTFYVSQKNNNLCESPKTMIQVSVNEPFEIASVADKTGLCSSGLFNRTGVINTSVSPAGTVGITFELFKDAVKIANNTSGEFEINGGGNYKVIASKGFCSANSELSISSLHPELASSPTLQAQNEICKNTNLTLEASGSFVGGNYAWYSSENSPLQSFLGAEYTLNIVSTNQTWFVAYGITTNDTYCETPRVASQITMLPDLEITAQITNTSCAGLLDGQLVYTITNGVAPYTFSQNGVSNSTGVFSDLSIGNYTVNVVDSKGCVGEKTVTVAMNQGVIITQQPSNISRCRTNIANFTLTASNYDQITWEKKLPGNSVFETITGENLPNLRIENIGNTANPHQTIYRAKLTKGTCSVYTQEAILFVNSISGTGTSKTICENASTFFNLSEYAIVGTNKTYQWQYRLGTSGSFTDVLNENSESLNFTNVASNNGGYYRCRITFDNGGGNTCVINTSTSGTKLTVEVPEVPILSGEKTICTGQNTILTASNCSGILTWSDGKTGLSIVVNPIITTTYTAICSKGSCTSNSSNSVIVTVNESPLNSPTLSVAKTKFCNGETINLSTNNCTGDVIWSNGLSGTSIQVIASSSFNVSAHCVSQNCKSPESPVINITVYPVLTPGEIVSNSSRNCSGFNPLTINSISSPNGGNIQWQKSENCTTASPIWTDISGEVGLTYNPPALSVSTCFRRMVSDSCQTVYSNSALFEIVPDPLISITSDKTEVCFGQKLTLNKTVVGGEGICDIQWQINKVSAAVTSSFWRNLSISEVLEFTNSNSGSDSTFYFRARIDCQNSSCNLATSNAISAVFLPELVLNTSFSDSTICSGSTINLVSTGCKGQILWSTGESSAQISVTPTVNTLYTVSCKNSCDEVSKSINISVVPGISAPTISVSRTKFCNGETINLSASNCNGNVTWSNGLSGTSIQVMATSSFDISAHCVSQNCQSPESPVINITVYPVLTPGEIVSNSSRNCSGFNPLTINSISSPNGGNIQWQKSENCTAASPIWTDISGEVGLTYNPPALSVSTCFRRMVSDSCQTVYSNSTLFEIVPDPVITITGDKVEVCFGQKLTLNKTVVGGEGICDIQWQINKVSAAVTSSFWRNLSISEVLEFTNSNSGSDSTFYFRARIDCQNSSCNLATSNTISAVFLPELVLNTSFSDSTVCSGSTINLVSTGCKGQILWSTGESSAQISVTPTVNTLYTVSCKNSCDEVSKSINISMVPGISAPTISVSRTKFCNGETIKLSANNCTGDVIWSNGLSGTSIQVTATSSFSISAHCVSQNCQSPESSVINITVYPVLTPGEIVSNSSRNCSGFNPLTINSISSPNGGNIKWQKSENCTAASPVWTDISGEIGLTYNPPAIIVSTCFRRMVSDSCQTVYSNSTLFEIVPDPVISISGDKAEVCFGQKLTLNKSVIGGEGICDIQWQINKVSAAVTSSFWRNLSISDVLEFTNSNLGNDSTFYFRARIDCQNSSCNLATSNAISAVFLPELSINTSFSDSTICSGSTINFVSNGCKGQILWSTGESSAQISVSPTVNTLYTVSCKNSCDEVSKSINISVVPGILAPTISVSRTKFCNGETINISASNCTGDVIWSNGLSGTSIQIIATSNFNFSAHCVSQNCKSPESPVINITVYPVLTPGEIDSNSSRNCSGFNPLTINSISSPNGGNIQWQKSENCTVASPVWTDISGEIGLTYNPPALLTSTCFRRMVSDSCQTVYSNSTLFEIVPDPVISITGDKAEVCFGQKLTLNKSVIGGEGICDIQWQINKVSAAITSSFWRNLSISEVLEFTNSNTGNDSTFYFRARIDCQNSSCNLATSNAISAVFLPELVLNTSFSDSTICSGSTINLVSTGCKGQILWSTGESSAQISVTPTVNTLYTVSCKNSCDEVSKSINISVVPGILAPTISVSRTKFCIGETINLSASNCNGNVTWSNGLSGTSIQVIATSSFNIYAHCVSQNCQSPESPMINMTVYPILTPGEIVSNSSRNCSGFNPLTVNSISSPNGGNIQWQKSENCTAASPIWTDISGETGLTYNPPALLASTCFRRMVSDSCQTVYSNSALFEIVPDPLISISGDKAEVCFGQKLTLNKTVVGGEGICDIQWQINKVSAAVTSSFWRNLSISEVLEFTNSNSGSDSTFYFRARIDCQNSSCNLATSNAISAVFLPELAINTSFSDSTICSGSTINLVSNGCKGQILWSTGESSAQISVTPTVNTLYTVSCKNSCDEVSKSINISVVPGIEKPMNITPESALSPEILVFNAVGQNIKWYSSETSTLFTTDSPQITTPGEYSFWATQTIGTCESPRLKITAKLNAALAFTSQPINTTNCNGNSSILALEAKGTGTILYKWQRKKTTENTFSDIPSDQPNLSDYNTNKLKISSLGNDQSPHLSKFRCIIRDDFSEITSNEVEISVNRIQGSLANQKLCLGNNFSIDLNRTHQITGIPTTITWQHRKGAGDDWQNLIDTLNISGSKTLQLQINNLNINNQQQYRCSILFGSSNGTCTETTDLMSLSVGSFPQNPEDIGFEFCQNVTSPKLELYEPSNLDVLWYLPGSNESLSKQPVIDTKIAGNQVYFFSFKNTAQCESIKSKVQIIIHPEPPKPLNTTPLQIIENQLLVFSAFGEQLKWYTSRTGKTFTTLAPSHQKIGTYDYYVSQTNQKGCESERTYIESEIVAAFGIATQPTNQSNCDNNSSTFSIKTKGSTNVTYRWQIAKNGVFEDIIGENNSSFKIDDVGKSPNIDGTVYRCIVSNTVTEIISNEVTLSVNQINGKLNDLTFCQDQNINATKFTEILKGNISQLEWQSNIAGSFNTVFTTKNINENIILNPSNSGEYRLRITFQNQGSSTCVRTSNNFKVVVHPKPLGLAKTNYSACQFSSITSFLKDLSAKFVLRNSDSSQLNITHFNLLKTYNFIGNYTNDKGCISDEQKLEINIIDAPKVENLDSTFTYCQFSNNIKSLKINDLNTFWFNNETDDESTENEFSINTSDTQARQMWVAIQGSNGCLSQKRRVEITLKPCYYDLKNDTCINQTGKILLTDEWNYFYDATGQIFAAIHPNGQNLGTAKMDLRNTSSTYLKDKNLTELLPRYFNLLTSKQASASFKIRFYYTKDEIIDLGAKTTDEVSITNYNGKNLDCDLTNNNLENNYWLETTAKWQKENDRNIHYVEFNTTKTGEFGLWNREAPIGKLIGEINENKIPELNISEKSNTGNYEILKSKDGKTWFAWLGNVTKSEFTDLKPFLSDNYYQLIYNYGNGIKAIRNTVKLTVSEDEVSCVILENPSENRDFLKLYFPNIDKTTIRLNTAMGQSIEIRKISERGDYFELYPNTQLAAGFYTLKAQNISGKNCSVKVWIR